MNATQTRLPDTETGDDVLQDSTNPIKWYVLIHRTLVRLDDDVFPPSACKLLLLIKDFAHMENGERVAWPGQARLASIRGVTRQTITNNLNILLTLGVVTTELITSEQGRMYKHYKYTIHDTATEEGIRQRRLDVEQAKSQRGNHVKISSEPRQNNLETMSNYFDNHVEIILHEAEDISTVSKHSYEAAVTTMQPAAAAASDPISLPERDGSDREQRTISAEAVGNQPIAASINNNTDADIDFQQLESYQPSRHRASYEASDERASLPTPTLPHKPRKVSEPILTPDRPAAAQPTPASNPVADRIEQRLRGLIAFSYELGNRRAAAKRLSEGKDAIPACYRKYVGLGGSWTNPDYPPNQLITAAMVDAAFDEAVADVTSGKLLQWSVENAGRYMYNQVEGKPVRTFRGGSSNVTANTNIRPRQDAPVAGASGETGTRSDGDGTGVEDFDTDDPNCPTADKFDENGYNAPERPIFDSGRYQQELYQRRQQRPSYYNATPRRFSR